MRAALPSWGAALIACLGITCLGSAFLVSASLPAAAVPGIASGTVQCRFDDKRFTEISGIALSHRLANVMYLHNDSGDGPYIYVVDATTCATLATYTVDGITPRDNEAIAVGVDAKGHPVIWLADIGDNRDNWPYVRLYRVPEPSQVRSQHLTARVFRFTYSDGPQNAEALLADPQSQRIWVATKKLAHGSLFEVPLRTTGIAVARKIRPEGGLVTDGSIAPDGSKYVLRDYVNATIFTGMPPGRQVNQFVLPIQVQGEAITWTEDGSALLIASEGDRRLYRVTIPKP